MLLIQRIPNLSSEGIYEAESLRMLLIQRVPNFQLRRKKSNTFEMSLNKKTPIVYISKDIFLIKFGADYDSRFNCTNSISY